MGSIREFIIRVFIPQDYTRDKVYVFYQLSNNKFHFFGEPFIAVIDVGPESGNNLNESMAFDNFMGGVKP